MKRTLMVVAMLAALTIPTIASADDQGWMRPEWNPSPPAWPTVDLVRLVQMLEAKRVTSDQDYVQLTQPQVSSPVPQGHGRVWTWDEIDAYQRSPIRNQGD
jgi:hypothetical protein